MSAVIAAVASAFPADVHPQAELADVIAPLISDDPSKRAVVRRLFEASRVKTRHLAMPLERYPERLPFGATNRRFIEVATDLAGRALGAALDAAGLAPGDVDLVMFTSVTGIAAPSVDAMLVPVLGLRPDVKRIPVYGLGCVAGAAGLARVDDYLAGHPDEVAVLLAVELCSLTFQHGDDAMANLVASSLFGDGAAAVVMTGAARSGEDRAGPTIVDSRSHLYPDTEGVIGFDASERGFSVVLTAEVPEVIERYFAGDVDALLGAHGLTIADVDGWIAHPGGPRVLESFRESLGLPEGAFGNSWRSLAAFGNMSSVSVLQILGEELTDGHPPGTTMLLFALGPGVSAELVLLRW